MNLGTPSDGGPGLGSIIAQALTGVVSGAVVALVAGVARRMMHDVRKLS